MVSKCLCPKHNESIHLEQSFNVICFEVESVLVEENVDCEIILKPSREMWDRDEDVLHRRHPNALKEGTRRIQVFECVTENNRVLCILREGFAVANLICNRRCLVRALVYVQDAIHGRTGKERYKWIATSANLAERVNRYMFDETHKSGMMTSPHRRQRRLVIICIEGDRIYECCQLYTPTLSTDTELEFSIYVQRTVCSRRRCQEWEGFN